jgi:hypothetical protein
MSVILNFFKDSSNWNVLSNVMACQDYLSKLRGFVVFLNPLHTTGGIVPQNSIYSFINGSATLCWALASSAVS